MNWFLLITIRRREGLVKDLTNHLSVSLCLSQNAISFRSIYMNKTSRSPSADGCSKCFITTDFFTSIMIVLRCLCVWAKKLIKKIKSSLKSVEQLVPLAYLIGFLIPILQGYVTILTCIGIFFSRLLFSALFFCFFVSSLLYRIYVSHIEHKKINFFALFLPSSLRRITLSFISLLVTVSC